MAPVLLALSEPARSTYSKCIAVQVRSNNQEIAYNHFTNQIYFCSNELFSSDASSQLCGRLLFHRYREAGVRPTQCIFMDIATCAVRKNECMYDIVTLLDVRILHLLEVSFIFVAATLRTVLPCSMRRNKSAASLTIWNKANRNTYENSNRTMSQGTECRR